MAAVISQDGEAPGAAAATPSHPYPRRANRKMLWECWALGGIGERRGCQEMGGLQRGQERGLMGWNIRGKLGPEPPFLTVSPRQWVHQEGTWVL